MALLNPKQLQGLSQEIKKSKTQKIDIQELLEEKSLTPADILDKLRLELDAGETGSIRLRAAEMGLKLNGLLQNRDESQKDLSVTIVIQDSQFSGLNPILVPRS